MQFNTFLFLWCLNAAIEIRLVLTYVQSCVSLRVKSFSLEQPFRPPHELLWYLYKVLDFLKSVLFLSFSYLKNVTVNLILIFEVTAGLEWSSSLFLEGKLKFLIG